MFGAGKEGLEGDGWRLECGDWWLGVDSSALVASRLNRGFGEIP